MVWWNELTQLQKIYASVAIPATVFMVIQLILMLLGLSHEDGVDSVDAHTDLHMPDGDIDDVFDGLSPESLDGNAYDDMHSEPAEGHDNTDALRFFTLRGIIAFFSIGGWMGVAAIEWKLSNALSVVLAVGAGWFALYSVAWLIRAFLRMQQSGNIRIENAVGQEGVVYLTIPADGRGKVNVIIQERLCEMDAVTKAGRALKTGEKITVTGVAAEGVLLVAPMNPPEGSVVEKNF